MDKTTPEQLTQAAKSLTEKLAVGAVEAVGTGKSAVDNNLDKARRAMEVSMDAIEAAHSHLDRQARRATRYVQDNPTQSLLIAAGVGALVLLIASLCAPKRERTEGYSDYSGRRW